MTGESNNGSSSSYRSSEMFAIFAIGFYWAWLHLIFFVPFGSFYGGGELNAWLFLAPIGFVMCSLAFWFGPKLDSLVNRKPVMLISAGLAVLGTVLMITSTSLPMLISGVVCTSFLGPTCIFPFIGALCKRLHPDKVQPRVFFLSMIISFFVYLMGYSLPAFVTSGLCLLLPVMSTILFSRAYNSANSLQASWNREADERAMPMPLVFISYVVVFSLSLNYLMGDLSSGLSGELLDAGNLRYILYALGIIVCLALVELFVARRGITVIPIFVAALATLALLLWVIGSYDAVIVSLPMSIAGYFLFVTVFWLKTGQRIAVSDRSPSQTAVFATAVNMLGLTLGSLLSYLSVTSLPVVASVIVACMICAFFVLSFFLLPHKTTKSLLVWSGVITHVEKPGEEHVLAPEMIHVIKKQAEIAGGHFNLTPRETETLCYLLRGWELQSIAKEEHLSRNTIKTHVTHIYQKLGVHTREECSMVVERLSISPNERPNNERLMTL